MVELPIPNIQPAADADNPRNGEVEPNQAADDEMLSVSDISADISLDVSASSSEEREPIEIELISIKPYTEEIQPMTSQNRQSVETPDSTSLHDESFASSDLNGNETNVKQEPSIVVMNEMDEQLLDEYMTEEDGDDDTDFVFVDLFGKVVEDKNLPEPLSCNEHGLVKKENDKISGGIPFRETVNIWLTFSLLVFLSNLIFVYLLENWEPFLCNWWEFGWDSEESARSD